LCLWLLLSLDQLLPHVITTLFITGKSGLEKIWKENQTKNNKYDEKLDQDDDPKLFPDRH